MSYVKKFTRDTQVIIHSNVGVLVGFHDVCMLSPPRCPSVPRDTCEHTCVSACVSTCEYVRECVCEHTCVSACL